MKSLAVLMLLSWPFHASAAALSLGDYVSQTVNSADDAFQKEERLSPGDPAPGLIYKQFFLGFAPTASFGISKVFGIQVTPELTFIWEKTNRD